MTFSIIIVTVCGGASTNIKMEDKFWPHSRKGVGKVPCGSIAGSTLAAKFRLPHLNELPAAAVPHHPAVSSSASELIAGSVARVLQHLSWKGRPLQDIPLPLPPAVSLGSWLEGREKARNLYGLFVSKPYLLPPFCIWHLVHHCLVDRHGNRGSCLVLVSCVWSLSPLPCSQFGIE